MMTPPLVNNVCALFSPTIEETVPHPIDIFRGHIHQTMGEEKDQNQAQSSRVHTLVHHVCHGKCELVHFSNGIPISGSPTKSLSWACTTARTCPTGRARCLGTFPLPGSDSTQSFHTKNLDIISPCFLTVTPLPP